MIDTLKKAIDKYDNNRFIVCSWVIRHNDQITFERLAGKLQRWAESRNSPLMTEDVRDFKEGKWLVLYVFDGSKLTIRAGRNEPHLQKQSRWLEGPLNILPEDTLQWYKNQIIAAAQN